jgi:uncharacterized protein YhbP (UPF0306 family)
LELQGVKISDISVYKWINKYVRLVENYLEKSKPMSWKHGEQMNYI